MTDSQHGQSDEIEPRERCPVCGELLVVESEDPLEEYCINGPCSYYRAEVAGGKVREER